MRTKTKREIKKKLLELYAERDLFKVRPTANNDKIPDKDILSGQIEILVWVLSDKDGVFKI